MKPLVSILIPSYNAGQWIAETLECCLAQTWPNNEIIVVDDGSKDDSLKIAKTFESRGVKVIAQPNAGSAAARNTALRHATGDYIQYLDADDLIDLRKIEVQVAALEANPGAIASGKWARFFTSIKGITIPDEPTTRDFEPIEFLTFLANHHRMMPLHAWLVPRAVSDAAGLWDDRLSIDIDGEYFARVVVKSALIKFVPEAMCYYRIGNAASVSRIRNEKTWTSAFLANELFAKTVLAAEDSARTRSAMARRTQRHIYESYPSAVEARRKAAEFVASLGGSDLQPEGTRIFRALRRIVGWKLAKRIQLKVHASGYLERKIAQKRAREAARTG